MKIAFRTDASNQIGTGHFMRCLTLAGELKKQGAHIRFLSRGLPTYLINMLNEKGIQNISLEADKIDHSIDELAHASWLGASQVKDSRMSIKALSDQTWDWLIVDHYALDARWEKALRPIVKNIMAIDDLADRDHDCDVLLDQNYFSDMQTRYKNKVPEQCKLLLGPRYAILREEFKNLRKEVKVRTGDVKKILVFFGGVDIDNYTMIAIEALSEMNANFEIDVVIGIQHPFKEQIQRSCIKYGFVCHLQTSNMAKLMMDADFSIGAAGSASWERCCLGLPSLLFSLADNQIAIAKELSYINACFYSGDVHSVDSNSLRISLARLLADKEKIQRQSRDALSAVDALGVFRVTNEM
jgi:UDP-2,4-diacetamido-2,4,6-trideoxy-beta-L-altropyranose hydrolase